MIAYSDWSGAVGVRSRREIFAIRNKWGVAETSASGWDTQRVIDYDNGCLAPAAVELEPKLVLKHSLPSRKPVRARFRSNVYVEIVNPGKSRFV
jgi:hypothetical protein